MSLLMQALKKAERAKQNHLPADELVKPSEEFDPVLTLAPQDPYVPAQRSNAPRLDPELSLSPLPEEPAPLLETPWEEATPPQRASARDTGRDTGRDIGRDTGRDAGRDTVRDVPPAETLSAAEPPARSATPPRKSASPRTAPPPKGSGKPARPPRGLSLDPQTLRLLVLGGVALLVILIMAFWYWRAVLAPGPGSKLPPVPMPAQQFENGNANGTALALVAPPTDAAPLVQPAADGNGSTTGMYGANDSKLPPGMTQPAAVPSAAQPAPSYSQAAQPGQPGQPLASAAAPPRATATFPGNEGAPADMHTMARPDALNQPADPIPSATALQQAPAQPYAQQQSQQGLQQQAYAQPAPRPGRRRDTAPETASANDGAGIKVRRSDNAPQVSPTLQAAYQAYTSGDNAGARQQYGSMLQREPNNRDALLGMAAVSLRDHQQAQAASLYLRLLELDPNDGDAVAGLIGLRHGDPQQSEARLKSILERSPEAGPALFALGNLYAQQGRWPEAQQIFFRAYSSTPTNPDYAFNLAVGLDHLNQPKLALQYYQRALALASDSPGTFDRTAARRRLHEISAPATPPAQP